ncbi:Ti-type conjugative transfer system protein TraG [Agrobacterium vitis]
MTASKVFLAVIPATTMIVVVVFIPGIEHWLAAFGKTAQGKLMLGRIGLALPYATAAAIGTIFLFAANGAAGIKAAGWGVVGGNGVAILIAVLREGIRLAGIAGDIPAGQSVLGYADPATMLGASITFLAGVFALRVAMMERGFRQRLATADRRKASGAWGGRLDEGAGGRKTFPRSRRHRRR